MKKSLEMTEGIHYDKEQADELIRDQCMTNKDKFDLIRLAIDLAGDGGCDPFTKKERVIMNDFLNELENKYV